MTITALLGAKLAGTTFLSRGGLKRLREQDRLWIIPLAAAGISIALAGGVWMLYSNYAMMAQLGAAVGAPELPIYTAALASWVLLFVAGFPIALSVLYFSRDTVMLAALPIPAYRIVAVNLSLLYLYALPVAALVFIPGIVAAASVINVTILFIVSSVLLTLVMPLVPLAVSAVLVMLMTRFLNLNRFRVALETLGMVLMIVLLVVFQAGLSRTFVSGMDGGDMPELLGDLILRIRSAVPPAGWYARSFMSGGAPFLVLSLAFAAGVMFLAGWAAQLGYLGQISEQGTVRERRGGSRAVGALPIRRSPFRALIGRELKILTSNSSFLFESLGEVLVFPIMLGVFGLLMPGEVMAEILPALDRIPHLLPIVTGVLLLMAGINSVSSAALSREGASFDLSLSLPLSGSFQVSAKIAAYLSLFWPAFTLNAIIAVSILRLPWWYVPSAVAAGTPYLVLVGAATIYTDIRRPLLTWNHPQQAVKQNMNVLFGMGLAFLSVALISLPAVFAAVRGMSPAAVMIGGGFFASVAAVFVYRAVMRYADRRYAGAFGR